MGVGIGVGVDVGTGVGVGVAVGVGVEVGDGVGEDVAAGVEVSVGAVVSPGASIVGSPSSPHAVATANTASNIANESRRRADFIVLRDIERSLGLPEFGAVAESNNRANRRAHFAPSSVSSALSSAEKSHSCWSRPDSVHHS
ncbi:MAG: hypothetical protein CL694_05750 [Chloroflexi bacterium]|nr:hypothetical protein [Chloroflexota bacterium]HAL49285.1 hypothetical protein [Dehalococcoidia bacterium]